MKRRCSGGHVEHHALIPGPLVDPVHAVGLHPQHATCCPHLPPMNPTQPILHLAPAQPTHIIVLEDEDLVLLHAETALLVARQNWYRPWPTRPQIKKILLNPVTFERGVVARHIDDGLVERPPPLAPGEVHDAHVAAHTLQRSVGGLSVVV
jgi:hypothetical protein